MTGPARALTWVLDDDQDEWETQAFQRTLLRRLALQAAEVASRAGQEDRAHAFRDLAATSARVRVGPAHATWFYDKKIDARTSETELARIEAHLHASVRPVEPFAFRTTAMAEEPDWLPASVARIAGAFVADGNDDPALALGSTLAKASAVRLDDAKAILDRVWPTAGRNIERVVRDVVWTTSWGYRSGTDAFAWGCVFINPRDDWRVPHFFETLLHEGGHLGLAIKETLSPLLDNARTRAASPLRKDPRPLHGIFHAAFVLTRMTQGYARYLGHAGAPDADVACARWKDHDAGLTAALRTLEEIAVFTEGGRRLFATLVDAHQDLRGQVPR